MAVHAPEKSVGYWDLARDHYGSCTPMSLHRNANQVIRAVIDGTATLGVLSLPQEGEPHPWWRHLIAAGPRMPRIIARLPFIENSAGRFEHLGALSIAQIDQDRTGDDVSLVAVEANAELSRGSLKQGFDAAGMPANDIAVWQDPDNRKTRLHLIEIADFVGRDDPRIGELESEMSEHVQQVIALGGYAAPLGRDERRDDG